MWRILLFFFLISPAWADSALPVRWQSRLDPTGQTQLVDAQRWTGAQWHALTHGIASHGFSRGALWLHAEAHLPKDGDYVLELVNPVLDQVELYLIDRNGVHIQRGGFAAGTNFNRQLFRIKGLQASEPVQIYLRVSAKRALIVWPRIYEAIAFCEQSAKNRFVLGAYVSLFAALCLFSLMAWKATRDRDFLESIFLMVMSGALQFHLLGVLHEYIFWQADWMDFCNTLFPVLSFVAFVLFSRTFLSLRQLHPRCDRLLQVGAWVTLGLLPLHFLIGGQYTVLLANLLGASLGFVALWSGLVSWRSGFDPARFFLLALGILVFGGMVHVLHSLTLLNPTPLTVYIFPLAAALNVLLLSFALADKVRVLRLERELAQQARLAAEQQVVEALRESELLLESRVEERTRQLQDALRQQKEQGEILHVANRRLSELDEERSAILGIAAHDLKNPTSAIMGYADLLRERWDSWDDGKKIKRIANIHQLAQHIFEIIRNLLDINAIEGGRYILNPERQDLVDCARHILEVYHDRAEAKHIRLLLEAPVALPVFVDRSALRQMLDNLVSNAVKYSPPGSKVQVLLESSALRAVIRVRDEGPGISEEDQNKLFRKFTRLSARPTGGEHSTGLGLSIVKHIVEASGGSIRCESRLGEGAIFIIELPAVV